MLTLRAWVINLKKMRTIDHSCKEIQSKIELYLDGELDRYTRQKVEDLVAECPICKTEYDNQSSLKRILNVGLKRKECTDQLRKNIVSKIRGL